MERAWKPQICYVLPRYEPDTSGHFFHNYEFLKCASGELDIFLVIEKAAVEPLDLGVRFCCQKFSFPPLRFLELAAVLFRERIRGRRYFYTHYSFYGALSSWLIIRLLGGTAYYWNSGEPWKYERPWFKEAVFRFILRHTILVTHPEGLADKYQQRYRLEPERIRIVPHYIEIARFQAPGTGRAEARRRLGIAPEAKVILFVHRLSCRKGAHLIPEIAAEVIRLRSGFSRTSADSAKHKKDVIFLVVGDGPERQNIEQGVRGQGLGDRVKIIGGVPQHDLPPYFWVADVLFLPSEEEGFPHVLLEAMAAGVPYVASDAGGVAEITPPELQEYIVPGSNIEAYARNITNLLAMTDDARRPLGEAEKEWVKKYNIQEVVPKFVALFQ